MFWVKSKIAEGVTVRTVITDENVFTVCPQCGLEHKVDLCDVLSGGDTDLYGTQVYCRECSTKRLVSMQEG